jgi:hypothetical protein
VGLLTGEGVMLVYLRRRIKMGMGMAEAQMRAAIT